MNNYRAVALTSVVMKVFERLVLKHLKTVTRHRFIDFSSAFNSIVPRKLFDKLPNFSPSILLCGAGFWTSF